MYCAGESQTTHCIARELCLRGADSCATCDGLNASFVFTLCFTTECSSEHSERY